MKNILIVFASLALILTSCQNNKTANQKTDSANEITDTHSAKNSIDWEGTYFGVLPCASCPGINTLITLNEDNTYQQTIEYLESDFAPQTTHGQFQWDKDENIITIEEHTYLVGENKLFALDADNKVIEGELAENYILTKTELQPDVDANEGYFMQKYIGSDKKDYTIVINTNPKTPTAMVESDGTVKMLSQTQAWAKGAEYSGYKTTLIVKGDKATLLIDNKKIELKQQ